MSEIGPNREFVSSVGLVITGTDLLPSDVTEALGLEPDDSWRRGDSKRVGTSLHEWGGWKKHLQPRDDGDPFVRDFRAWTGLLTNRTAGLRKLQAAGCTCVLDCFISVSGAALVELGPALQRELAALGIEVSIAIWANQNAG